MRNNFLILCLGSIGLIAANSLATAHPHNSDGDASSIKRFAFLPHVFVDLENGIEHDGIFGGGHSIRECHSAKINCLDGTLFKLAWSKNCVGFDTASIFEVDGMITRVTGSFEKPGHHGTQSLFIAVTDGHDNNIFVLSRQSGLVGLIRDPAGRSTLAQEAREASFVSSLGSSQFLKKHGYAASYLTGIGNIGECEGPKVRSK